jgi:Periplasmic binding protein-like domain
MQAPTKAWLAMDYPWTIHRVTPSPQAARFNGSGEVGYFPLCGAHWDVDGAIEQELVLPGPFDRASGERAADVIAQMEAVARPTAVFAANDETALGVLSGLARLGVGVPRQISVCGFGDLPVARIVIPALTTVRIALRELEKAGARTLLALLRHEEVAQLQVLPTAIVERVWGGPAQCRWRPRKARATGRRASHGLLRHPWCITPRQCLGDLRSRICGEGTFRRRATHGNG